MFGCVHVDSCYITGFCCRHMTDPSMCGDRVILYALSLMWDARITVLEAGSLREYRFRHNRPLSDCDFTLLYNGTNHYSAICEY